jgi:HAD superfamily hydrolase (TIGR01509 family)
MIKAIAFDLDGVLLDSKQLHFEAFNMAVAKMLGKDFCISREDHLRFYDGLPTFKKIDVLQELKGLKFNNSVRGKLWKNKQRFTEKGISSIRKSPKLILLFKKLKKENYLAYVATNSVRKTAITALSRLGIKRYIAQVFSSEDVYIPKPHPEIYLRCILAAKCKPKELLVIEDSPTGVAAAAESGAEYFLVQSAQELSSQLIFDILEKKNGVSKKAQMIAYHNMNVLIPMAGEGSRFREAGFSFPKPLIEIPNFHGNPMIKVVYDSLGIRSKAVFIVQEAHRQKYNLDHLLKLIASEAKIIAVSKTTEGAACTCLLAKSEINSDEELIIANSDQFVEWKPEEFIYFLRNKTADFGILTFPNTHPKWSYAKTDEQGRVIEVAEKKPISQNATVGIYYWRKGSDFVRSAEAMIKKNIRVGQGFNGKGEFYVAPSFNELILEGKMGFIFPIAASKVHGLGTPEDLKYFNEKFHASD